MDAFSVEPHTRKRRIECKPELVISSLQRFYSTHPDISKVLTYLHGDAPLSLRIIDWFVTKYSRTCFVRYPLHGQEFLVYLSYKGQLKAYSKQYFDPNCRRERIMFKIPGQEPFMTTIGKLNFFRWALETKILDYIEDHQEEIRTGYNVYLKNALQHQKKGESSASTTPSASSPSPSPSPSAPSSSPFSSPPSSASSTPDAPSERPDHSGLRTTRRRTKQTPSSLNKLQVYTTPIVLDFH
jgi:hypothetical protein